jgi:hypothetical protein
VWLPEAGGPVDVESPVHQALMLLLGSQSRHEVLRARHRVLAAMRAQTCVQGRFLGVARHMGTGWWMPDRIRPRPMRGGAVGCTVWSLIQSLHRGYGGRSSTGRPGAA